MRAKLQLPNESTLSAYYWIRLGAEIQSRGLPLALRDLSSDTRNQIGGDIHAAVGDRAVLIEFKRDLAGWSSEETKKQYTPIKSRITRDALETVSKAAHWFAWGNIGAGAGEGPIQFAPYVNLGSGDEGTIGGVRSLSAYVQSQCTPLDREDPVGADLKTYADYVKRITEAARGSNAFGSPTVLLWAVWRRDGELDVGSVGTWEDLIPALSLPGSALAKFLSRGRTQ